MVNPSDIMEVSFLVDRQGGTQKYDTGSHNLRLWATVCSILDIVGIRRNKHLPDDKVSDKLSV